MDELIESRERAPELWGLEEVARRLKTDKGEARFLLKWWGVSRSVEVWSKWDADEVRAAAKAHGKEIA